MLSDEELTQRLNQAIKKVIDQQIQTHEPPEVKQVFDELIKNGLERQKTYDKIGEIVGRQVSALLQNDGSFNMEMYKKELLSLLNS